MTFTSANDATLGVGNDCLFTVEPDCFYRHPCVCSDHLYLGNAQTLVSATFEGGSVAPFTVTGVCRCSCRDVLDGSSWVTRTGAGPNRAAPTGPAGGMFRCLAIGSHV